jgi:DNA polymerase III delta prime subunit
MALKVLKPIMPDDFVLQAQTEQKLHAVLSGMINFPANGISGLLLYGVYGTGKTTMANLLPGWIETAKKSKFLATNPVGKLVDLNDTSFNFQACCQGQNGASIITAIQNITSFVSFNLSGLHFVVLDEFDLLTSAAITSLKSIMNRKDIVFIMTTNNLNKIDKAVQNRSILLDMNAPPVHGWVSKIQGMYQQANLTPPPTATLNSIVAAGNGSARSILSDIEYAEVLRNKRQGGQSWTD